MDNIFKKFIILALIIVIIIMGTNTEIIAQNNPYSCKMKKDKIEYKDDNGKIRGILYFQYPEFNGKSSVINKINKKLSDASNDFLNSSNSDRIKEYVQYAIENNQFYDKAYDKGYEQYYYKTSCKITYAKNNIISMHMKEEWFAGGVHNQSDYGWTFDMKKGEILTVKNVISGNVKEKILEAAKKYLSNNAFPNDQNMEDRYDYNYIKNTNLDKYKFYLKDGKVYICFESYELQHANSTDIISLKGKYK